MRALLLVGLLLCGPALAGEVDRRVPVLFQGRLPGCLTFGAAAVAQYHGHDLDPLALHRSVLVTPQGVAWADVARALTDRGIPTRAFTPEPAELRALLDRGLPLLVAQTGARAGHAVVLERYLPDRDAYVVMDPANPARETAPAAEIERRHAGAGRVALLVGAPPE